LDSLPRELAPRSGRARYGAFWQEHDSTRRARSLPDGPNFHTVVLTTEAGSSTRASSGSLCRVRALKVSRGAQARRPLLELVLRQNTESAVLEDEAAVAIVNDPPLKLGASLEPVSKYGATSSRHRRSSWRPTRMVAQRTDSRLLPQAGQEQVLPPSRLQPGL
jgi:hypothetical protein